MKFPDFPRSGQPVMDTVKQIINYLKSSRIISINGVKGTSSTNGTTFTIPIGENKFTRQSKFPFEITKRSSNTLRAEAGTFCGTYFEATIETTPANGNWYFYGKVILDQDDGSISTPTVDWYNAVQSNTSTDKYHLIGTAGLTGGAVTYFDNTDYGPINYYPIGDVTNNWTLFFF